METTSRVGPEQKKKKSQILDSMETTFPLRLEGVATKQPSSPWCNSLVDHLINPSTSIIMLKSLNTKWF